MPCYHPLKAFPVGITDKGKTAYKVTSYKVDHLEKNKNGTWVKCFDSFPAANFGLIRSFIEVPCGQCVGCRLERSRAWADRCMMELKYHRSSYFITLTYDDLNVPLNDYADTDTGVLHKSQTLVKKDFQLFIKRLRKNYKYDNKLRYFACGEYGDHTARPHYHAIIFGLELDDLQLFSESSLGYSYYNSPFLDDCWQHKGHVVIAPVTWETCAYTARYVMKKLNGQAASVYTDFNIEPEFVLMSRRPGIARQYFLDHPDCLEFDKISISTDDGGKTFKPPRYFEKIEEELHPTTPLPFYEKLNSESQKIADSIRNAKLASTSQDYLDYLLVEENNKLSQIKSLERKCI